MGKYGRFTGGTHFKRVKKRVNVKKVIEPRASEEQLVVLKLLGLNFQANSISAKKANQLIKSIEAKRKHVDNGDNNG